MNQQGALQPTISEAISSIDGAMHDGMHQIGNAAKGVVDRMIDLSLQALQPCERLTEQNIGLCTAGQNFFLRSARQVQADHVGHWAAMPLGGWLKDSNSGGGDDLARPTGTSRVDAVGGTVAMPRASARQTKSVD